MKKLIFSSLLFLVPFLVTAQSGYVQEGKASFYADKFEGRTTASGERYTHNKRTCAHLSLPFGTLVRVTNLNNDKTVVVRVNDRGPFVPNRIIDLSLSAAKELDFVNAGLADVKIEVVEEDSGSTKQQVHVAQIPKTDQPKQPVKSPAPKSPGSTAKPTPQAKLKTPATQPASNEVNELYQLNVKRLNPQGFAVQIGGYKELANLLRIADELTTSLKEEVRVQVGTHNGEKIYRLMVGGFPQRSAAENLKNKVERIYPGCFVVELK